MFVRVRKCQTPYYATACGTVFWQGRYHLIVPDEAHRCFTLVPYIVDDPFDTGYEVIRDDTAGWIHRKGRHQYSGYTFHGMPELLEKVLPELLYGRKPPVEALGMPLPMLQEEPGWHSLLTPEDADSLFRNMAEFHDALIERVLVEQGHHPATALVTIDNSCWYGRIEICFEGVQTLHLRPAHENELPFILDGTLRLRNCLVFFSDQYVPDDAPDPEDSTWIRALYARWRKID